MGEPNKSKRFGYDLDAKIGEYVVIDSDATAFEHPVHIVARCPTLEWATRVTFGLNAMDEFVKREHQRRQDGKPQTLPPQGSQET